MASGLILTLVCFLAANMNAKTYLVRTAGIIYLILDFEGASRISLF